MACRKCGMKKAAPVKVVMADKYRVNVLPRSGKRKDRRGAR